MLSQALLLLQLADLASALHPTNADGYGGRAHRCTSAFGFGPARTGGLLMHPERRLNRGLLWAGGMEEFSAVISAAGKSQGSCCLCVGWPINAPCSCSFCSEDMGFVLLLNAL